jgi:hypothetical protein
MSSMKTAINLFNFDMNTELMRYMKCAMHFSTQKT